MTALTSLKQLHYLLALSEQLNFTRAAESCFVTQSTLSAGLKELEDVLGAQLVERDRQTVLMTPLGLEVVKRARAILAAAQDLVEIAAGAGKPMMGLLRLGVIPTIAPFLLPQSLRLLRERYPALRLALREDLTASLLLRLEHGQLDFALIALPYDTANLLVEPLFDDDLWVVGRKGDPEVKARKVDVTPSMSDRLLLLEEGHCLRDHALYACGASIRRSWEGMEATSLLTLVQMVESGLGIGLVPEMAIKRGLTASPNLVARPMAKPSPKRTIALVARRSTSRLADLKALAEVVQRGKLAAGF
ncbi:MAG: LysR family transcriptional regulator [Betaproteobacteria bacterium]|nr:LysR family transcriptional regulator [Betaproteobacteria bacterium]